ncbi:inactive protein RESTRICTED TEV MOVEMENT 2 [Ricinus communis]|uniref:Small heat-shock protein, putative n=1 Tax=Ricinus communis TaxID=3988 RepID=B9RQ28_RICCO|nr:inactive protein RESTRICTED TEV MOVEMENT 2 [Ricinus communis]EEF46516.1 small heat-shock protein, putative [Ricinus communis]|eukprot:XP_002515847.1 inactive protein RESTRICTED TEV MOVEMENT 2 [Ricinus communis]
MAKNAHVYQDFEPTTEWVREAEHDTLLVYLPGFKKEQLKVQVTSIPNLRISGERSLGDSKWSRFSKELRIPSNYDANKISARFEGGILKIKHPKIIKPATKPQENANPSSSADTTNDKLQAQRRGRHQPDQEAPPKIKTETNDASDRNAANRQELPDKEKEQKDANGKNSDANSIPGKTSDNEKIEGVDESGKMTSTGSKQGLAQEASASCDSRLVYCKQVFGGLLTEMKKARKSTKLVVAAGLLVLVLGLYVNSAIRSEESKN